MRLGLSWSGPTVHPQRRGWGGSVPSRCLGSWARALKGRWRALPHMACGSQTALSKKPQSLRRTRGGRQCPGGRVGPAVYPQGAAQTWQGHPCTEDS